MQRYKITDVKEHLESGRTISGDEARSLYGVSRLTDIIYYLRKDGYIINSEKVKFTDRYGRNGYYIRYSWDKKNNT